MANEFDLLGNLIDQPFSDPTDLVRERRRQIGQRRLGTEQAFAEFERPESRFQQIADPIEGILSGLALITDLTSGRKERRRTAPGKFARLKEGRALRKERRKAGRREELRTTLAKQAVEAGLQDQLFSAIQSGRQGEIRAVQQKISNKLALGSARRAERQIKLSEETAKKTKPLTPAEKTAARVDEAYGLYNMIRERPEIKNNAQALGIMSQVNPRLFNTIRKDFGDVQLSEEIGRDIVVNANKDAAKIYEDELKDAMSAFSLAETEDEIDQAQEELDRILGLVSATASIFVRQGGKQHGIDIPEQLGTREILFGDRAEPEIPEVGAVNPIMERILRSLAIPQTGRAFRKIPGLIGLE